MRTRADPRTEQPQQKAPPAVQRHRRPSVERALDDAPQQPPELVEPARRWRRPQAPAMHRVCVDHY